MTIAGIDYAVSVNGHPSLSGKSFAGLKATEGTSYTETGYALDAAKIRNAGLVLLPYHFAWPNESVDAQAQHFLEVARPKAGDVLFLDFETYPDGRNMPKTSSGAVDWAVADRWRLAWITKVKALTGGRFRIGTYCNVSTWRAIPSDNPGDFLFIAWPEKGSPPIEYPWLIQQTGISGVDQDIARFPNVAAMRSWAGGTSTTSATTTEGSMGVGGDLTSTKADAWGHGDKTSGWDYLQAADHFAGEAYNRSLANSKLLATLQASVDKLSTPTVDATVVANALGANQAFVESIATAVVKQLGARLQA